LATRPKPEVELARIEYQKSAHRWDSFCGAFRTFCRSGVAVAVSWFGYKAIAAVAGTTTEFKAALSAAMQLGADRWIAYIVGVLGVLAFRIERRNKQRAIKGMKEELKALQDVVDPGRSRSGLADHGGPSKEDLAYD
jgi:hypothetical protein